MNDAETIKDIRENWPKHFDDEHKPPIDGIIVSISLRDPDDRLIIKDITIMEPNGTEWNIAMCGNEVIDYGITMPRLDITGVISNKGPIHFWPLEQWGYGSKLLELESEKPKKVIHRRIILD